MSTFTNNHTLYITSGVAHREQLEESLGLAFEEISQIVGHPIDCKLQVNIVPGKNNEYLGICYVWLSNPLVYNLLLGLDDNGKERYETIPDPNFKPITEEEERLLLEEADNMSWCGIDELDSRRKECPMICRKLKPLVTIPGYTYTEDQYEHLVRISKGDKVIPKMGYFEVGKAFVNEVFPDQAKNVLSCMMMPEKVPTEFIKKTFSEYVLNPKKVRVKFLDKEFVDTYPVVCRKDKYVFIVFDPNTHDASFVKLMTTKMPIKNVKTNETLTLIFGHAPLKGNKFYRVEPPMVLKNL